MMEVVEIIMPAIKVTIEMVVKMIITLLPVKKLSTGGGIHSPPSATEKDN